MNFEIISISKIPETCFFIFQRALKVVAGIRLPVHRGHIILGKNFANIFGTSGITLVEHESFK